MLCVCLYKMCQKILASVLLRNTTLLFLLQHPRRKSQRSRMLVLLQEEPGLGVCILECQLHCDCKRIDLRITCHAQALHDLNGQRDVCSEVLAPERALVRRERLALVHLE